LVLLALHDDEVDSTVAVHVGGRHVQDAPGWRGLLGRRGDAGPLRLLGAAAGGQGAERRAEEALSPLGRASRRSAPPGGP
jgi:hypothetical protein